MRDPALAKLIGSSAGAQEKFLRNGVWYKKNLHGYEGLAEELCSVILSCSDVKEYVTYERCDIDGKPGCRSKDFTKKGEVFLTL